MNNKMKSPADGRPTLARAFGNAVKSFASMLPQLVGVILLIGLFQTFVTGDMVASVFSGSIPKDTILGAFIGSISAGNPVTSYIIGGELIDKNVNIFAVTAFIVAWVTVGIIQLPAEASILGKRFAFFRNMIGFLLAIAVPLATVMTMELLQ